MLLLARQVNPAVSLDIQGQLGVLEVVLARPLDQVGVDDTLSKRPLDVEPKAQMVGAPFVRLFCAGDVAIAGPARPRCFAKGGDL